MTEQQSAPRPSRPSTAAGEVVAGLVNDGSAARVARAAVRLAAVRQCGVRFVQVLTAHAHEDAGSATFGIALRALRGQHRIPVAFEVLSGHPGRTLVERSATATALVVGADTRGASSGTARYCRTHARCPVVTASAPDEVLEPASAR
ncbi:hypothetical protein [Segeticoccus rhizosphaerae]|jgi:hypothetical protein|uniref:hypothetical protein n=1 Tax=Segeticoccus rhizosphaerae TaxID=1104777 RepID=UPI0010C153A4|nr:MULTISPECIES: hypothetical protein [Intrasporangiaceae]